MHARFDIACMSILLDQNIKKDLLMDAQKKFQFYILVLFSSTIDLLGD